jgi:hypothetical protein
LVLHGFVALALGGFFGDSTVSDPLFEQHLEMVLSAIRLENNEG